MKILIDIVTSEYIVMVLVPLMAFAIAAILMPIVARLATRFGVVATPAASVLEGAPEHRTVPLLGGSAIIIAVLAVLALTHALAAWLFVGGVGLMAVGLIDDAMVLKPRQKFIYQLLISAVVVTLYHDSMPLTPWRITDALLDIFWLLATTNAYNLIDGLDGLAGGIGIAASATIAAVFLLHGHGLMSYQALAMGGALAAFMLYNYHPASIFMGDCGALPVGLILGVLSLQAGGFAQNSTLTRYTFPILVLMVPLLDTAIVSVTRIATGNSISRRGLDHSHHRLLHLGLTTRTVVAVCWVVALVGGACAVMLTILPHRYVIMTLPLVMLIFAVAGLFMMDLTFETRPPGLAYGYLQGFARFILNIAYKRRVVEFALDLALITAAYFGAYLLRRDFSISDRAAMVVMQQLPWILPPTYAAFIIAGVYRGIWRYAGISELIRFANGAVLAGIIIALMSLFTPLRVGGSIIVLDVILLFNLLVITRMSFRVLRKAIHRMTAPRQRVLIVGAGVAGSAAAHYLFSGQNRHVRLVGFIDDDAFKVGKLVNGHGVLGTIDDLERVHENYHFDQIMLAAESLDDDRLTIVRRFAETHAIAVSRFSLQIDMVPGFGADSGSLHTAKPLLTAGPPIGS